MSRSERPLPNSPHRVAVRRRGRIWASSLLGFVLAASAGGVARGDTLCIPDDYYSIQEAIEAAEDGDTILVAPETYIENLDFFGKAVTVASEEGRDSTIIEGSDTTLGDEFPDTVTFQTGESSSSVLQGFTIRGGARHGVYCNGASPTIIDNRIEANASTGVRLEDSSPTFERNRVSGHSTVIDGGMYVVGEYSLTLRDCEFTGNHADFGSAASFSGATTPGNSVTLENCLIADNTSDIICAGVIASVPLTLERCRFTNNSCARLGIGGLATSASLEIVSCEFADNIGEYGGALAFGEDRETVCVATTFSGNSAANRGGAVWIGGQSGRDGGSMLFDRCTFSANSAELGSAIALGTDTILADGEVIIRNSILWGHEGPLFELSDGSAVVTYSDVEGGYDGEGNIDSDPLFGDPDNGDYTLSEDSPCIDAGDPESPLDPDGTTADMGAFVHMQYGFKRGDVNGNDAVSALLDAIALLTWQFAGGEEPPCMDAADADDDGAVNALLDGLYLLLWTFLDGPPPPSPGPDTCGVDLTEDDVDCSQFLECP